MILPQLRHVLLARHRKGHGIHSPYLYHLITQVLFNKNPYYCFDNIETSCPATEREHLLGQTLFRLAEDINASTMVVCCEADAVDVAYLESVKADAHIVQLTDAERLNSLSDIDLAVFDDYHDTNKLLNLFEGMLSHTHSKSVFFIKHIHKKGMEQCWNVFISHPHVKASLDVYHYGILLFKPDLEKRHYLIKQ